ncbi:type VII secretion protein EccB [Streptomyces hyaluromycini]|uniref:type VII secretion protein EccB n=1 Tax=Streptomyces hyaluromycini TaxID=1377993 RepID=UPI000B5CC65F|nr:type VII secretion protein EccB [Streptomyces hyaluromycini]
MQTRREQVQAHRFVVSRLTTGLMRTDPDALESPNRRTNRGLAVGGGLGAVAAIGFLVFGFISPGGSTAWQDGKTLVVESGTGNRYLYDGSLRPVRNYASARLIVGTGLSTRTVPAASLADTPRGSAVGIPGAPDTLPAADRLDTGRWEVCASTRTTGSSAHTPATTLVVDGATAGAGLPAGQALLVSGPDRTDYLVWRGNRYRLASGTATAEALGYGAADPLPVSAAFLDALPAGADLAPPAVPGQGTAGPALDGRKTRVGQVFVVRTPGSTERYYLLLRTGLVPLTATQAALSLSGPGVREKAYGGAAPVAVAITADALNGVLVQGDSDVETAGRALPATPPALLPVSQTQEACVRLRAAGGATATGTGTGAGVGVGVAVIDAGALPAHAKTPAGTACLPVDSVAVPPDGGSLVRALGAGGGQVGDTTYLVTETGMKYLVPSAAAAQDLGYDLSAARGLPSALLAMLPTGPDLSPQSAIAGEATAGTAPGCAAR